jgi:hypothetical protein
MPGAGPTFGKKPLHKTVLRSESDSHFPFHFSNLTSMRANAILLSLCAIVVCFCAGCVVKRTVTDDGAVVSKGYVVKTPFSNE